MHTVHNPPTSGRENAAPTKQAQPSPEALRKAGKDYARKQIKMIFADSNAEDLSEAFPRFSLSECELGKILGKGGFGTVSEVRGFRLQEIESNSKRLGNGYSGLRSEDAVADDGIESRTFLAEHCLRNSGDARYCVKYLSKETVDKPALFIQAIVDIAVETRILSSIEHPNICKLRGLSSEDPYQEKFFLVLDRLYDTLESKIEKWARRNRHTTGFAAKLTDRKGTKQTSLMEERLVAAFDLSAALGYLHSRNIIYRDVKPENCGFDCRGDIKLFDFGLAKEFYEKDKLHDDTYNMSAMTGSIRYMAPEVALGKTYNAKADTYSMSILLWQIISLCLPFQLYTCSLMKELVHLGGKRPVIPEGKIWSASIKLLLNHGWSADVSSRFSMNQFTAVLKKELVHLRAGDDTGLEHQRRRSTFVFRKK
jgi:serine/threonine protein kinase